MRGGRRSPRQPLWAEGVLDDVDAIAGRGASSLTPAASASLAELYASQRGRLTRLALLLLGDMASAEDAVQDAFAAVQRRWARAGEPESAEAYVTAAVVNRARTIQRHRGVIRRYLRAAEPEEAPAADAAALLAEEHRTVVAAVRSLPPRQREVVVLRYWADLSEVEIAAALGISCGTVKSSASRGLATIHQALKAENYG